MMESPFGDKKGIIASQEYCCEMMHYNVTYKCEQHPNPFDCPNRLIYFDAKANTYGIIVHNGGESFVVITVCPWCGKRLAKLH